MKIINKNIVVWFSCGAASAVAAKKTIEIYGNDNNISIVNTPIYNEHKDNQRFLKDIEKWIGKEIILKTPKRYPNANIVEVFDKRKYMSGVNGAVCTKELKKEARYEYEKEVKIDFHVLGFTIDEWKRQKKFNLHERQNTIPVLINNLLTKEDCFNILKKNDIQIPFIYSLGFKNANCIGCVKSSSPKYWNLVRKNFPKIFDQRATQSKEINCKLVKVKGKRIFLNELDINNNSGSIDNSDCGIFCDIK
jgi:hypothetical protein